MSKYLEFERISEKIYAVKNKKEGFDLGIIGFHQKWKKMVFIPEEDTFYDAECMGDIIKFMGELK
jgi:hypothetical protein